MDLLVVPADSAFPTEQAPYICTERWDGGAFLTYAYRKGKSRVVPFDLRRPQDAEWPGLEPFRELLDPSPRDQLQDLYQTWFFFGLLAEFLGLNEQDDGERLVEAAQADVELAALYDQCVFVQDNKKYLTGAKALASQSLILTRLLQAKPDIATWANRLFDCLHFTISMLQYRHSPFDDGSSSLVCSIAALGELLGTILFIEAKLGGTIPETPKINISWCRNYVRDGGKLEAQLLGEGWCRSDVEKLRYHYQSLNTVHYLSRPKGSGPKRDHGHCDKNRCLAFQVDMDTLSTSTYSRRLSV